MRSELLSPTALDGISALDRSAGHVKPVGIALGIDPGNFNDEHPDVPDRNFKELPDGTALLSLADKKARLALTSLPPGSIIDLFDVPDLAWAHPAVVISHKPGATVFWSAKKIVQREQGGKKVFTEGEWDTVELDDRRYSEVEDVRLALADLYSLEHGAEATQMLGAVYSSTSKQTDTTLAEVGHASHERPARVLGSNIVLGNAVIQETSIFHLKDMGGKNGKTICFARVRLTSTGIEALRSVGVSQEERLSVLQNALMVRAESLADLNPTRLGHGTAPEAVLDVMIDSMGDIAETVGNGISAQAAGKQFHKELSKLSKSYGT